MLIVVGIAPMDFDLHCLLSLILGVVVLFSGRTTLVPFTSVNCIGTESRLLDCPATTTGTSCSQFAGVNCGKWLSSYSLFVIGWQPVKKGVPYI